jgi:predicted amino acid dehydrogenase
LRIFRTTTNATVKTAAKPINCKFLLLGVDSSVATTSTVGVSSAVATFVGSEVVEAISSQHSSFG